MGHAQA